MRFTLVILAILSGSLAGAQTSAVQGQVLSNKKPVPFASISIMPPGKGTTSDSAGYYQLQQLEAGSYQLKISATGFAPVTKKTCGGERFN